MSESSAAGGRLSRALSVLVVLALLLLLVRVFVASPMRIRTGSMSPTLTAGEHVLAEKVTRRDHDWRRGDIVAFRIDGRGDILVKRVVALAGDAVGLEDGRLVVNGDRVTEPYTDVDAIDSVYFGPVTVPAAHLFVMGDNRANSRDSRVFGPVADSDVMARVSVRLWPLPPSRTGLR